MPVNAIQSYSSSAGTLASLAQTVAIQPIVRLIDENRFNATAVITKLRWLQDQSFVVKNYH
jgi:hypothetical protein